MVYYKVLLAPYFNHILMLLTTEVGKHASDLDHAYDLAMLRGA